MVKRRVSAAGPVDRSRRVTAQVFRSPAEQEAADRQYWRSLAPQQRVELARQLSEELWRLKGSSSDYPEFVDLLRAFAEAGVRFLVVGAYALALHGRPRATGDLDLWVEPTPGNAERVFQALRAFGAPLSQVTPTDFSRPGTVFQIGVPPRRIDILTKLTGLQFAQAWEEHVQGQLGPCQVAFLGKQSLIKNKRALRRPQDLVDLALLEESRTDS